MVMVKYGDVTVQLIDGDGDAVHVISTVKTAICRRHGHTAAAEYSAAAWATWASDSYDALLRLTSETVHVG